MARQSTPSIPPAAASAVSVAEKGPLTRSDSFRAVAAAAVFALAAAAVYSNTLHVEFVFDDLESIVENTTIRNLGNLPEVLFPRPRGGTTIDGRPILNLSLAVNYAISGLEPWSYHALNIAIHVVNGCLLFGILRRLFGLDDVLPTIRMHANLLAFGAALLWIVHPLQTAAITYVIQRAEALMGLFYFATLYCFVRSATAAQSRFWGIAAVAVCWLGQGAKEVMATAPLAVLALDAALFSGSVRRAIRARRTLYLCLAASWPIGAGLILWTGSRSGTVSMSGTVHPLEYFAAQCGHLLNYLKLSIWPWPQVFDYGKELRPWDAWQAAAVVVLLAILSVIVVAFWRWPKIGVLGVLPVLILAPTSSFIPVVTQIATEHRMYLPLAAVTTAILLLSIVISARVWPADERRQGMAVLLVLMLLASIYGGVAYARNDVYATPRKLWEDTVRKRPTNVRGCAYLAAELTKAGQGVESPALFEQALAASWNKAEALCARGRAWLKAGNIEAAIRDLRRAIKENSACDEAYGDLAVLYVQKGELDRGLRMVDEAIRLRPENGRYRANRAIALAKLGRADEALAEHRLSTKLSPSLAEAHFLLGSYLYARRDWRPAAESFAEAAYFKADYADAEYWLASACLQLGDLQGAARAAENLVKHESAARGWELLATIQEAAGNPKLAVLALARAVEKEPRSAAIRLRLARLLGQQGEWSAALPAFAEAARLEPDSAETLANYAAALHAVGQRHDAAQQLELALSKNPQHPLALRLQAAMKIGP